MRRVLFALLAVSALGCSYKGDVSFDPRVSRGTVVTEGSHKYPAKHISSL